MLNVGVECRLQFASHFRGAECISVLLLEGWGRDKISVVENCNLLVGNCYFAPDCDVKVIECYLEFHE
jgi:hypothetical protein